MSTRKTVQLEDFGKELGDFSEHSLEAQKRAVINGIAKSIPDLVAASPVDTGLYAASWGFTETETGAIIGNHAPYAGVVEHGSRPFKAPLGPLLAWAQRVLRNTESKKSGKVLKHTATYSRTDSGEHETTYAPEVWALALYVQKKIAIEGISPKHVMEKTIPKILKNIKSELKRG